MAAELAFLLQKDSMVTFYNYRPPPQTAILMYASDQGEAAHRTVQSLNNECTRFRSLLFQNMYSDDTVNMTPIFQKYLEKKTLREIFVLKLK